MLVLVEQPRLQWCKIFAFDGEGNWRTFAPNRFDYHAPGTGLSDDSDVIATARQRTGFANIGYNGACLRQPKGFFSDHNQWVPEEINLARLLLWRWNTLYCTNIQ